MKQIINHEWIPVSLSPLLCSPSKRAVCVPPPPSLMSGYIPAGFWGPVRTWVEWTPLLAWEALLSLLLLLLFLLRCAPPQNSYSHASAPTSNSWICTYGMSAHHSFQQVKMASFFFLCVCEGSCTQFFRGPLWWSFIVHNLNKQAEMNSNLSFWSHYFWSVHAHKSNTRPET